MSESKTDSDSVLVEDSVYDAEETDSILDEDSLYGAEETDSDQDSVYDAEETDSMLVEDSVYDAEVKRFTVANEKITSLNKKYERLDAILRLKYQIGEIEVYAKSDHAADIDWNNTSRQRKWKKIFNFREDEFIFPELVSKIREKFGDFTKFVKSFMSLYANLEMGLHEFVEKQQISDETYKKIFSHELTPLLNSVDVD